MFGELLLLCAVGSLIALTVHEVGPFLIHRPIASGPLLGAMVGMPEFGFLLGACMEWVWIDRIPAGGIRTPAVTIGITAALVTVVTIKYTTVGFFDPLYYALPALLVAALYILLFVPVDGGLRRLWNLTSEGVVSALGRGSMAELRAYAPTVLLLRWIFIGVGLLTAAGVAYGLQHVFDFSERLGGDMLWPWIIPAAFGGFLVRRAKWRQALAAVMAFMAGFVLC